MRARANAFDVYGEYKVHELKTDFYCPLPFDCKLCLNVVKNVHDKHSGKITRKTRKEITVTKCFEN